MRRAALVSLVTLAPIACRGPDISETSASGTSQSETDDEESGDESGEAGVFVPGECGSWQPPVATTIGELPPEQACAGELCPVFTEIGEPAGLATTQFADTHPAQLDCIFPRATEGGFLPYQDCEPQWFTGGVAVGDVDRDGLPDLYMTRLAAPDHLFLNQGDGRFLDIAESLGLADCSWTNGANFGDIDNDGDLDLFVTTVGDTSYQLWLNTLSETGVLGFEEQGSARGFALESEQIHSGESVTFGDYDRDGWLDVHVNEWIRTEHMPTPGSPDAASHGSRLLHNLGEGYLEDVTDDFGMNLLGLDEDGIHAFSSTFVDLDGDGWQELAIAVDFHRSRMFWNEGGVAFTEGSSAAGVNRESNAMGSAFGDVDGDGDLDWFVTSIAEADECEEDETPPCWSGSGNRLYSYAGNRNFTLAHDQAGVRDGAWAWGAAFFDADNDGDQDLSVGNGWPGRDLHGGFYHADTPTKLWLNDGSGVMSEEGEARGVFDRGQGRSVVAFDYDRDGDLDLLVTNHGGSPRLFRNDGGNRSAWLRIELSGTSSNRDARGAKIRVQVEPEGPWQVREVGAASHFLGEGELIQHFGLGPEFDPALDTVHRVEIEWPASGELQVLDAVEGNQTLALVEGE